MPGTTLKEKLIEDIVTLPEKQVKEVIDFIEYLKLKEDVWFIKYVNQRSKLAKSEKQVGKKFTKIEELQREYR
jgi:hypothetical protein